MHVAFLDSVSRLSRKYGDFLDHVIARQVNAWVGLTVSSLNRFLNSLRESDIVTQCVKDVVESSREYSLDLQDAVTRVYQVVNSVDNRKPGSDIGLKQEFDVLLPCN